MTDSFKDKLQEIADSTQRRLERETEERAEAEFRHKTAAQKTFAQADAFNKRVLVPVLAEFAAHASGAGEFTCEFNKSDSQPTFTHTCKLHDRKLSVSLLYWVAG